RLMASHGASVFAVEPNAEVLRNIRTEGHPITLVHGGAESVQLDPASLDIVTFFYSLHHIPLEVRKDALSNASQALKPTGMLYIVEPVAIGPAYRVLQPIDDEATVRLSALKTLDVWLKSSRFTQVSETILRYKQIYPDFEGYKASILRVDERRAAAFEEHGEKTRDLFEKYGDHTTRGYAFDAVLRAISIR
ncbi:hypothetical protein MNBD_ALPHA04-2396, partial [hydrothermal vent metagenome]